MRTVAHRGMPPIGSVQDRIACEMIHRERRRAVMQHSYLGRIIASGLRIPEHTFSLLTSLLSLEVFQGNYAPDVVEDKEKALHMMLEKKKEQKEGQVQMFQKLHKLTADDQDLRPASPEDIERVKRRLRARRLKMSTKP